ncbi:MAG: hypothetical protein Ctma_0914 [Catillopecten margaritatus gill symbiont]|uniref:Uncharacterized protein n=1 Tax=Catillopecten margaritatus gill symbiont TaxID=3083288 RepID=A0AAU6PHG5_9GAMM
MSNIKQQILDIRKSDDFLKKLYKIFFQEYDNSKVFYQAVASLHNSNEIDFTEEILRLFNNDHSFFNAKSMFEEILPDLDIPVQKSMDCIKHIFQESGDDLSAGTVFSSFEKYCEKDEDRVEEALQIINYDISRCNFIPPIIRAGSKFDLDKYVIIAIDFTKHNDVNLCKEAIYSLGQLQYENHPVVLNQVFQVIKNIIETTESCDILSVSIGVIFTLSTFNDTLENKAMQLIEIALKNADDNILHSASRLCFYKSEKMPIKLFGILLDALENVNSKYQGTINNIGYGLQYLLEDNQGDMVVNYLEQTLIKNPGLSIKSFDDVLRDLKQKYQPILNQIITKWLISGNINLCKAVMDIIGFFHGENIILSADLNQLKTQDSAIHLFVIKKAIGWLFYYQTSAVSFIVSMVEILDKDNLKIVEELLFDPLIVSYSKEIIDCLKSIDKPKAKTKKIILNLSKRLEKYHNDLDSAWDIKELQPSEEQKESYHRYHNRLMSKAMNESKKDSVFLSLVNEFTVLYGRRSVTYHPELGSNPKDIRQEMTFQKSEFSVTIPSLEFIDPHGLDYMLRVFRSEQLTK